MKPSRKSIQKAFPLFKHLLDLGRREVRPLPAERATFDPKGVSSIEWLVINESQGKNVPTKHPLTVEKITIGRSIKGLTKDMWIADLRDGLITKSEVKEWAFSESDAQDVINRAFGRV